MSELLESIRRFLSFLAHVNSFHTPSPFVLPALQKAAISVQRNVNSSASVFEASLFEEFDVV